MMYLANPVSQAAIDAMARGDLGMLDTPYQGKQTRVDQAHAVGAAWAADNGCYGDRWTEGRWWAWLNHPRQLAAREQCLFATAPDVVGDAVLTEERSTPWLARIRELGYKVAYVAQDGLTRLPWPDLDVLFIGGSTQFKIGPAGQRWVREAVDRGVPVHMGRVNSWKRYLLAHHLGCSTVDGTYLIKAPDVLLPDVLAWQRHVHQLPLFDRNEMLEDTTP